MQCSGHRAQTYSQAINFGAKETTYRQPWHDIKKELLQSYNVGSNSNVNFRDKILQRPG